MGSDESRPPRAEAIGYAAKVLTNHPNQGTWEMYARVLGDDSWKRWEIEDATGYHAVWFYSLLAYASDIREDESLYRSPIVTLLLRVHAFAHESGRRHP